MIKELAIVYVFVIPLVFFAFLFRNEKVTQSSLVEAMIGSAFWPVFVITETVDDVKNARQEGRFVDGFVRQRKNQKGGRRRERRRYSSTEEMIRDLL